MKTQTFTGKSDLIAELDHLLPGGAGGSTVPLHVDVERGETWTKHADGSPRSKLNGSATLTILVRGGAKDEGQSPPV